MEKLKMMNMMNMLTSSIKINIIYIKIFSQKYELLNRIIFMSKNYNFYEEIISIDNERRSLQKLKAKLSNLNSKEELDYVNSNLTQLSKDSLEFKICKIIQKIDKMSQDLSNSIYEYWGSLL
jgi:hypothetical protein